MIGRSGSKMGSLVALLVKLISAAGVRILHDFPHQVALEPRQSECAGARGENVESSGLAGRPAPVLRETRKIYKNFISQPLASSSGIGPLRPGGSISSTGVGMDAIYLLILAVLYGVTHALVWAFERLGKTS